MATTTPHPADPLVKSVTVTAPPARAFEIFTRRMSEWWPLTTHSVGRREGAAITVAGRVGGEITEALPAGGTSVWGTVTRWEPPHLVACTWHPGRSEADGTLVEVTFTAVADRTRVELTHSGWEGRPDADRARADYDAGWEHVLSLFAAHAA
ncbi:SRPBCC domain-containing protein [Georgenia sp. SYP-B2076]|uniref:SRPBCC domain-containing protein n=1 Tax=Georgenia sp. SYP-B2076 TaxID=2495881 RepID=UPI000F8EB0B8|nr:SRPBCC domain-containing protein [Georgenia sp. SYP-B2076]